MICDLSIFGGCAKTFLDTILSRVGVTGGMREALGRKTEAREGWNPNFDQKLRFDRTAEQIGRTAEQIGRMTEQ